MPVDFQQYDPEEGDRGLRLTEESNAYRILQFLSEHADQGFTPKEISQATEIPRGSVGATLTRLHDRDLVRHKEPYWAIAPDDRLATYGASVLGLEAAADRFGDEDWGTWEDGAVDPRTTDAEDDGD